MSWYCDHAPGNDFTNITSAAKTDNGSFFPTKWRIIRSSGEDDMSRKNTKVHG